jgi:hypothetical protein
MKIKEEIKKILLECRDEDEQLCRLTNLFKSYARLLVPRNMDLEYEKKNFCYCEDLRNNLQTISPLTNYLPYCGCIDRVVFWNGCCEEMLRNIEEVEDEV